MTSSSETSGLRTSPSLLVRVQENEAGAWTRLVDLYAPLVHHWCRRANFGPEDTADVFQDVFGAVAEHIGRFRRRSRPAIRFCGWLRTIARTKIIDHARRMENKPRAAGGTDAQMRFQAVPDPLLEEDPSEDDILRQQLRRTLDEIRGDFEERTWQAFWRVQMEGKDVEGVGRELGMTGRRQCGRPSCACCGGCGWNWESSWTEIGRFAGRASVLVHGRRDLVLGFNAFRAGREPAPAHLSPLLRMSVRRHGGVL